jgi:uncharacterized protein (TIGR02246 family)
MTATHDTYPAEIEAHVARWARFFNRGDTEGLARLYEHDGVLVPVPGHPVTGAERSAATAYLLSLGLPVEARLKRCYVADDVALALVEWSINGTGPDGNEVSLGGTSADVLRRGADGEWRYAIDNPSGTA